MKKIIVIVLIILIGLGGLYLYKNNLNNDSSKDLNDNYLSKRCIVIKSNIIECNDNIILELDLNDKYNVGDILNIKYLVEFNKDNIKKIDNIKSFDLNLLESDAIFKDYYNNAFELLKKMSIDEKIGQLLFARVSDVNQIKDLKEYKFGGYLLFKRDFTNKTKEEVIKMIKSYQDNSKISLLIGADEEGGIVTRISSNSNLVKEPFKSPRVLYLEGGLNKIKDDTISKNKILESLGINVNLAPVVDVSTNENDYMYKRSLGENSETTSEFSKLVIETSKDSKVSYCLKHFPGYGNNADTHIGLSLDTRDLESIKNIDLPPFESGIKAGAESVLVSHNIVSSIDKDNPASISIGIHNLLRDDLKFTGIVITDDLSMGAIEDHYKDGAVVNAINSGNDLLIVSDYKSSIKEIKDAINNKKLSENIINKRVLRILAWKYYKGLVK